MDRYPGHLEKAHPRATLNLRGRFFVWKVLVYRLQPVSSPVLRRRKARHKRVLSFGFGNPVGLRSGWCWLFTASSPGSWKSFVTSVCSFARKGRSIPLGPKTSWWAVTISVKLIPMSFTPLMGQGQGHSSRPSPAEMCDIPIRLGCPSGWRGEGIVEVPNARSRQVVNAVTWGPAAPGVAGRAAVFAAIRSRMFCWEMPIGAPRSSSMTSSPSSAESSDTGGEAAQLASGGS